MTSTALDATLILAHRDDSFGLTLFSDRCCGNALTGGIAPQLQISEASGELVGSHLFDLARIAEMGWEPPFSGRETYS